MSASSAAAPAASSSSPAASDSGFWLHDLPGHRVRRLHQRFIAEFNLLVAEVATTAGHGAMTHIQFAALAAIEHRPGSGQAAVARLVGCDKVTVSQVLDRLIERGWVTRSPDPDDGRAYLLKLSAAGSRVFRRVRSLVEKSALVTLPALSADEHATLLDLLARLTMPYESQ